MAQVAHGEFLERTRIKERSRNSRLFRLSFLSLKTPSQRNRTVHSAVVAVHLQDHVLHKILLISMITIWSDCSIAHMLPPALSVCSWWDPMNDLAAVLQNTCTFWMLFKGSPPRVQKITVMSSPNDRKGRS